MDLSGNPSLALDVAQAYASALGIPLLTRREIERALRDTARAFDFTLSVPGSYATGTAYDDVLEYLRAQGRDFAADTRRLREHVRLALIAAFADRGILPGQSELMATIARAVLEWIVARFDRTVTDIRLPRLSPRYLRWKAANGYASRVGWRTGELRNAIAASGRIDVETSQ